MNRMYRAVWRNRLLRRIQIGGSGLLIVFGLVAWGLDLTCYVVGATAASAPKISLQTAIEGARKEGVLNLYAPSSLRPAGAQAIKDALNSKYGLNLEMIFTGAGNMIRDVNKVITEQVAGAEPAWDLMVVTDAHYATLIDNGAVELVNWPSVGVDSKSVFFNGQAVAIATQFVAPAYNQQLVRPSEVPRKWEDLLDPKWKGKMGVPVSSIYWAWLAQVWGEQKTTQFVEALAKQNPMRGQLPEIYTRLQMGEISLAAVMINDYTEDARKTGAPVVLAEDVNPIIASQWMGAPLKHAAHKNAAILLMVFLSSKEGQDLWSKLKGQTSMYVKGTPAYQFAQERNILVLDYRYALSKMEELTNKYGRLLGYR